MDRTTRYLVTLWVALLVASWIFGMGTFEVWLLTALAVVIVVLWMRTRQRQRDAGDRGDRA
jgi:hypothetical protein